MEITDIKLYPLRDGLALPWGIVVIETDEGIRGIGESGGLWGNNDIEAKSTHLNAKVRDQFVGTNPLRVEKIRVDFGDSTGRLSQALLSGIEIACLDITGKHYGVPVHQVLGGKIRDSVRAYANGWWGGLSTPEEVARGAERVVERGYDAVNFSPFEHADRTISNEEQRTVAERVGAVREAVGPDVDIIVEGHARLTPKEAIRIGRKMEEYNPLWYEAPIRSTCGPRAFREVREALTMNIADDLASIESKFDAFPYISNEALDIIQPDPGNVGGLSEIKYIGQMADAASILVCPHSAGGPVHLCASVHVDAVLPNFMIQEAFTDFARPNWVNDVFDTPIEVEAGKIEVPDDPGLGIEFDESAAREHTDDKLSRRDMTRGERTLHEKQWVAERPPGWILED